MASFSSFNNQIRKERSKQDLHPQKRKQIKLGQFNSLSEIFEEETISLSSKADFLFTKVQQKQNTIAQDQINFLSLRERFQNNCINYPLPTKFAALLFAMKTYEWNLWKKKQLILDTQKYPVDIIYIRQIIKLSPETYQLKFLSQNKCQLTLPKEMHANLIHFEEGPIPLIFQNRIQALNVLLDEKVQAKHQQFLCLRQEEDFSKIQEKLKMYHPEFDIESIENLELAELEFAQFSLQEKEEYKNLVTQLWKYYQIRNVSFVFLGNLMTQMKIRLGDQETAEIYRKIQFLLKLLPDIIQTTNSKQEIDRDKWIVQLNKKLDVSEVLEKLDYLLK